MSNNVGSHDIRKPAPVQGAGVSVGAFVGGSTGVFVGDSVGGSAVMLVGAFVGGCTGAFVETVFFTGLWVGSFVRAFVANDGGSTMASYW